MSRLWPLWLFMLLLPLFLWIRWSPEAWVQQQLQEAGLASSVRLVSVATSGLGLAAGRADIQLPAGFPLRKLQLNRLELYPAWSLLLTGVPGVTLSADLQGRPVEVTLEFDDSYGMRTKEIDMTFDIKALQALLQKQPLYGLDGQLRVGGKLIWEKDQKAPISADLSLVWNHAQLGLAGGDAMVLGEYQGLLTGEGNVWNWLLEGGTALRASGKGSLQPRAGGIGRWSVVGELELELGEALRPMLGSMLPGAQIRIPVTGTVMFPEFSLNSSK